MSILENLELVHPEKTLHGHIKTRIAREGDAGVHYGIVKNAA